MQATGICESCGTPLPDDIPGGVCPQCLLATGLAANLAEAERTESGPPRPGVRRFGDYELLEEVARGGMGVVYRARQVSLDRVVAVKMLLSGPYASPEALQRFRLEARATATLHHPNLVAIHEFGVYEGQPYFSMDYVPGPNLAEVIGSQPLPARRAARYAQRLAQAVHYAHEQGILHRDLKPSNVLIGPDDEPRITDFGLARRQWEDSGLTITGQALGSPNYMPPERASGRHHDSGPAGDVYSLGAILYHLLTGRPPFAGDTLTATLRQVQETTPAAPRLLNPGVAHDLETLCLKCLEKDPARRFASALELGDELRRFLAGEPIRTRPVGVAGRLWRWGRRNPRLAALSGAVVLLALAVLFGTPVALWRINRERGEALRHAEEEQRQRRLADATLYRLEIQRVQELFATDKAGDALALLASMLRRDPGDRAVAEWLLNELTYRNFALPIQAPFHHPDMVYAVEFSQDGRRLLTVSRDCRARVWDVQTGQCLGAPLEHDARQVRSGEYLGGRHPLLAAFSPDSTRVVTASIDRTARVWDAATGKPVTPPLLHPATVNHAAFTRDGRQIATACQDGLVRFWEVASGQLTGPTLTHSSEVNSFDFSGEGRWLATAAGDGTAQVWEAQTGQPVGQPLRHAKDKQVRTVRFDRAGARVVTGSNDNTARVWDARTGRPLTPPLEHEGILHTVEFSPDGVWVLTSSHDKTARLWDATTGQPVGHPLLHTSRVRWAEFSPEGYRIITASEDGTARLWDARTAQPLTEPLRHGDKVWCARFAPEGQRIATASSDRTAQLWDIRPGNPAPDRLGIGSEGQCVSWSRDSRCVLTRAGVLSWAFELEAGEFSDWRDFPQPGEMSWAELSPDDRWVLTAGADGTARVRDRRTERFVGPLFVHRDAVWQARFSPDGRRIVTASADRTARLWDAETGSEVGPPFEHPDVVRAAQFSPDGQWVATACADRYARLWEVRSGQLVSPPMAHEGEVLTVEFSPDGRRLATSAADLTARLWELPSGQLLAPLRHNGTVQATHFSPDGRRLVTASADRTARVWDAATGQPVTDPLPHGGAVRSAWFTPDGSRVLTASEDSIARFWDAATGHLRCGTFRHPKALNDAQLAPDGRWLATACEDWRIYLWEFIPAPAEIPTWLPVLTEAVVGQRLEEQQTALSVSPNEYLALWAHLRGSASDPLAVGTNSWLEWFFADRLTRMTSPSARHDVQYEASRGTYELQRSLGLALSPGVFAELWWALQVLPEEPRVLACLARALVADPATVAPVALAQADWLSRRALTRQSATEVSCWARAVYLDRAGKLEEAIAAIQQAIGLDRGYRLARVEQARLFEKAGRIDEARQAYVRSLDGLNADHEYRADLLLEHARFLERHGPPADARAAFLRLWQVAPRDPASPPTLVDLGVAYNAGLPSSWVAAPYRGETLAALTPGRQRLGDIDFDARGIVQLSGRDLRTTYPQYPERVEGIPVGQTGRRLHFLHAAEGTEIPGTVIGHYVVHYADGRRLEIPIRYHEDVLAWNLDRPPSAPPPVVAWTGENRAHPVVRLYRTTCTNPTPDVAIARIDLVSTMTGAAPFLVAVTMDP